MIPFLSGIIFLCSESKQRVSVTVHMYNAFVRDEEIWAFLLRYCDYVSGHKAHKCVGDLYWL